MAVNTDQQLTTISLAKGLEYKMRELSLNEVEQVNGAGIPIVYGVVVGLRYASYIGGASAIGFGAGYLGSFAQSWF